MLTDIVKAIPLHAQSLSVGYEGFVNGCITDSCSERKSNFQRIVTLWKSLSLAQKIAAEEFFMCACAWCAAHTAEDMKDNDWQALWQKHVKQRRGNLSREMQAIAERLDFSWPEVDEKYE